MNLALVDLLKCPICGGNLSFLAFTENPRIRDQETEDVGRDEVQSGLLKCSCGKAFPIIDGVPRLLETGLKTFPDFVQKNREKIATESGVGEQELHAGAQVKKDDFDQIRSSFSREWSLFDYNEDNTWGWTLAERKRIFLDDVAFQESQVKGKLLLDAGCGNGTLTAALTSLGMNVVGIDLNDELGKANKNKAKYANGMAQKVQYVQGNLFNPPLKPCSFDLIYSSGVIHHTPDSKATFGKLVPLVKNGGRLYVWVYGRRSLMVRAFMDIGRRLKRFMSAESLLFTCRVIAPFYKVGTEILNAVGIAPFRKRKAREITLDLFDAFAPEYNHWHTEDEVKGWFKEKGFINISVSGKQKHGFGVYGDKSSQ
jgi:SAM-dependent methyltransferase/uncharacterized protein YbaR (Trm112 family)